MKSKFTRLRINGLNSIKFINDCILKDIKMHDLNRIDAKTIEFSLDDFDLKKLKSIDSNNLEIEVISSGGLKKFIKFLNLRMGLILGIIFSIILLMFTSNRLFYIQVSGLNNITYESILMTLNDMGIKKYEKMTFDTTTLERGLIEKFDFSFVSIITKGNSLIINVKEELKNNLSNFEPITAPYNMIIEKINVFAGTSNIKIGDIVYAGDIIVQPYEIRGEEKFEVEPKVEISGITFFSESYECLMEEEIKVRTGKEKTINNEMYLGKIKLYNISNTIDFADYEIEECQKQISNYFLPLNIKKTIAYELETKKINIDFEKEKQNIIDNLKEKVYNKVPNNLNIDSEDIKISSTNYSNIVTIYLKSSVYLKYNIN